MAGRLHNGTDRPFRRRRRRADLARAEPGGPDRTGHRVAARRPIRKADLMVTDVRQDGWRTPDGEAPQRPTHVIAHLSDTHLTSAGVRYNGVLDSDAALHRAL